MKYQIDSNYNEFTLYVVVKTVRPEKIHITLKDPDLPNTVFTDRWKTVTGKAHFFIRVPVSGKRCELIIYNERTGNIPNKSDNTFEVEEVMQYPLEKKLDVIDFDNPNVRQFVSFATKFCFNAGWIDSNKYVSQNGQFQINYVPVITGGNGQPLQTPARISDQTGTIDIAQKWFVPYTVPMRMVILLHEFSHYFLNDDQANETEADLNGLLIYLGLGYPRIEAEMAFTKIFMEAATPGNKKRYDIIDNFIKFFDESNVAIDGKR